MARRRQPPGRKRRTREHVIADLGVNFVERVVLLCGYTVERTTKDYGIDLMIETFDNRGEVEIGKIAVQVKATDAIAMTADSQAVQFRVLIADLKRWLFELVPPILIVYDAQAEVAYWLDVQEYARADDIDIVGVRSATLRIPVTNRWSLDAVRQLRVRKNRLVERYWRLSDEE